MILTYTVEQANAGKALKSVLKRKLELSERLIKKLKYDGRILCNSVPVHVNHVIEAGDLIEVNMNLEEESEDILPEDIDLDVLFEDDFLIAINKQPDMVVHPTCGYKSGTVANAVMHHFLKQGLHRKIRPVNRLDRDTTGIIIFAKNQFVQEYLVRQMKEKTFIKEYIGVVTGELQDDSGVIELPIERKPGSIILRQTSPDGARSITHYKVLERLNSATLVKFRLETGRTHQIRVHCQAIGHPLVGDTLYSDITSDLIGRQALHSDRASFFHPKDRRRVELCAPIPPDILNLLDKLR